MKLNKTHLVVEAPHVPPKMIKPIHVRPL